MTPLSVAVWQEDPRVAQALAESLSHHFHSVHVADSLDDIRSTIITHRAEVLVMDMEGAPLKLVQLMHQDFPGVCIVCTHRVADESMWAAALDVGASDYCQTSDTEGILLAAIRNTAAGHSAAA